MGSRMDGWEVGDYLSHFLHEFTRSEDEQLRVRLSPLIRNLESLDAEFMRESSRCGVDLGSLMDDLHSIAGRMGYCRTDRGFAADCDKLYRDMETASAHAERLKETCFV